MFSWRFSHGEKGGEKEEEEEEEEEIGAGGKKVGMKD